MKTEKSETKTETAPLTFDPWAGLVTQDARNRMPEAERPPASWLGLPADVRGMLGALALQTAAAWRDRAPKHGSFQRFVAARIHDAIRERAASDPAWRKVEMLLQGEPVLLLELVTALLKLGDVQASLLARRAAIDSALEKITPAAELISMIQDRQGQDHKLFESAVKKQARQSQGAA